MTDRVAAFETALAPAAGRTALIVVDMQRAFLEPGEAMEVPPAREVVPRIQALLTVFRARRLPVVFTEFLYTEADICVLATVVGGFNRKYRITVVEDGVATQWPEIQRATLDIIGRAYGRVQPAKAVVDEISNL